MNGSDQEVRRSPLRTALLLVAAWLVTLVGLFFLYAEFRDSGSITLLGNRYTGREALLIVSVYTALPITLFAVALKKLLEHNRLKR